MKKKPYNSVGSVAKSITHIVEKGNVDTPNTQIHDRSLSLTQTFQ